MTRDVALIMAGGTGGHVFPALATTRVLQRRGYRIVWLDEDYSQTVIGRNQRDYVWIMAREPTIPDAGYRKIVAFLGEQGYDTSKIQKVPQRWD